MKRRPLPSDPVTGEAPPLPPTPAAPSNPEHHTPPRSHTKQTPQSTFPSSQSPLQSIEYSTPPAQPSRSHHPDQHSPSPLAGPRQEYATPTRGDVSRQPRLSMDPYDSVSSRHHEDRDYSPKYAAHQQEQPDLRERHYPALPEPYEAPPPEDSRRYSAEEDRPPPPPAHRSRHNSGSQELVPRNAYDTSPSKSFHSMPMRHDVLRNEAHRHSISSYPGRPTFRAYDSAPPVPNALPAPSGMNYEPSAQRHHSYDQSYDPHYRSMQPTVEDAPEPPTQHPNTYRHSASRMSYPEEIGYEKDPSPAPLNLSRSPGASPFRDDPSPSQAQPSYQDQNGYQVAISPLSNRDYSHSPGHSSYHSHSSQSQHSGHRAEPETTMIQSSPNYSLPALPPSLVPGLDPRISQEISERIYEDRRQEQRYNSQSMTTPTRGRPRHDSFQSYEPPVEVSPGYNPHSYERRVVRYNPGQDAEMTRSRGISPDTRTSPNPQHAIRRKSVSPVPPPAETRRLSGVPFGPDSYDELNPSLVSSNDGKSPGGYEEPSKIITHDGREIDPSDHLPMESWAPEPENQPHQTSPDPRARPSLSGAQPMPPSTRRTPRSGRPHAHSMSSSSQPYLALEGPPHTPPAPNSAGRTRLQKKANRGSMGPSPAASSPLAPLSPDNYQDRQSPYTPTRGLPRASTWDHQNENRAPYHSGPPIPAKIPLALMSGANGAGTELALMEEMSRIDIGSGRSRRRGGY